MTRHYLIFFVLGCCYALCSPVANAQSTPYRLKTVVIDAGHGGKDPGAIGSTTSEKHITLQIALRLGKKISEAYPALKVVYTRSTDTEVPLHQRAELANQHDADLFISIHCNSVVKKAGKASSVVGVETYVLGLHSAEENLEVAKRENAAILLEKDYEDHYDGFDPLSPETHIMLSLFQNAFLHQSIQLAEKVQQQAKNAAKRYDRGVRQAGFLVLRATTMPSILVETGFISNEQEEKYLASADGQQQLATAIFEAFKAYKAEVEGTPLDTTTNTAKTGVATAAQPVYRLQLAVTSTALPPKHTLHTKFADLTTVAEAGKYKHYTGNFSDYDKAAAALRTLRAKGYPDAFMVAFLDGEKISLAEAKAFKPE